MFLNLINKIQAEHAKFKIWVKTYGYSIEVMKFIKNLTENSYNQINGNYISPILNEMLAAKRVEIPNIVEAEIVGLQEEINELLEKTCDLYLKPGTKREKTVSTASLVPEIKNNAPSSFNSKLIHDVAAIHRLFDAKVSSLKLIFRAS